ncbi:RNA polymerase sigma factor [Myxococcota bacterium]|nr:RNA polymerase sigma factor [Myxococcota bacterium]
MKKTISGEGAGPDKVDVEALARLAQTGDSSALNKLLTLHKDQAWRVALRLTGNPHDAEEALQSAFERVMRHLNRYDPSRPFRPWLMKVVVNQARTQMRKRKLKILFFAESPDLWAPDLSADGGSNQPDQAVMRSDSRRLLETALKTLSQAQREAFVLKHIEELSYDEIAVITGDSVGSLKVRVHRARLSLLKYFRERGVTFSKAKG